MPSFEGDPSPPYQSRALSADQRSLLTLTIDHAYYAEAAGIDASDVTALVDHYLANAWSQGHDPSPTFNSQRYADATPIVRQSGYEPFLFHLFAVIGEERLAATLSDLSASDIEKIRRAFDADWYLETYEDVRTSANDPFLHYLTTGWREGRDPSPGFSTRKYLERYADIAGSGMNPFCHYVLYGLAEGRSDGRPSLSKLKSWDTLGPSQRSILTRMFAVPYYAACIADDQRLGGMQNDVQQAVTKGDVATPSFRATRYLKSEPGIVGTAISPFLHYLFVTVGEIPLDDLFAVSPRTLQKACEYFDTAWYLYSYPDVQEAGHDAFIHYMTVGWTERRDPSRDFSTAAYLLRYPDIGDAEVNPFLHWISFGKAEGRSGASSASSFRNRAYTPSITAVILDDGGWSMTAESVAAIVGQSYADLQVIRVGGLPTATPGDPAQPMRDVTHLRANPAASITELMGIAAEQSTSELLWFICAAEIHDLEFLSRLASSFADGSVQIGFGQLIGPGDMYYAVEPSELSRQMAGWDKHTPVPAARWFHDRRNADALGRRRTSFLWRRRALSPAIWQEAETYGQLAQWRLYLEMASGGQIAIVRDAIARDPDVLIEAAKDPADDPPPALRRLQDAIARSWPSMSAPASAPSSSGGRMHILIVTHGIFAGGAENLPIQLANDLVARDVIVSMLIFKIDLNPEMRATLNPGVSIYEADWVLEYGRDRFLRDIGCSVIHSHGVVGEMFFYRISEDALPVPYVATLHGSYEAATEIDLPTRYLARIVRHVDLFVYTADKNLAPLLRHDVDPTRVVKMSNAMPVDHTPFRRSRAEMGIAEDAIVFTLVARGIPEKGWATAVSAFQAVRAMNPHRAMHLCLVGEGEEPDRLAPILADDASISFLGFQLRIHGLYRMTDVALMPTRFAGESFPLCLIQALQVGVPVIATNIGEIASMLTADGVEAGILVENNADDERFDRSFIDAMQALVNDDARQRLSRGAEILGRRYEMEAFTTQYIAIYKDVMDRFFAAHSSPDGSLKPAPSSDDRLAVTSTG